MSTFLVSLMLLLWAVPAAAFVLLKRAQSPTSSGQFAYVDESEWYSPPPPFVAPNESTTVIHKITPIAIEHDEEYFELLDQNDDRLLIIKFYGSWCKTCAKVGRKLELFSHSLDSRDVNIAHVEYGKNEALCRELGITKLPTVQMVLNHNIVQEFSCPPPQFPLVKEYTDTYVKYLHDKREYGEKATKMI